MTLYDPVFSRPDSRDDDLEAARRLFASASRPYLRTPWSWAAWAVILPIAALATPWANERWKVLGVLMLWTVAIAAGGLGEAIAILRPGGRASTGLARWVMRAQGNLSLIAVALSILLVVTREAWALPAVWLLLLGHSFFGYGGLALREIRGAGLLYQFGGVLALVPAFRPLWVLAATTAAGNLWIAVAVWRLRRERNETRSSDR